MLDTLDVFTEIVTPSILFDEHLSTLVVCRLVTLSLEHGNSDAACFAYVWLAMFAGPRLDNYKDGFRFGQLGYDLVEKRGLIALPSANLHVLGRHGHAMGAARRQRTRACAPRVRCSRIGSATSLSLPIAGTNSSRFVWQSEIRSQKCRRNAKTAWPLPKGCASAWSFTSAERSSGLIRTLRGVTPTLGRLDHDDYCEPQVERDLASNPNLVFAEFYYWTRKVQAHVFAGDYASAAEAAFKGQRLYWTSAAMFETAEFRLYAALAHAGAWSIASPEDQTETLRGFGGPSQAARSVGRAFTSDF